MTFDIRLSYIARPRQTRENGTFVPQNSVVPLRDACNGGHIGQERSSVSPRNKGTSPKKKKNSKNYRKPDTDNSSGSHGGMVGRRRNPPTTPNGNRCMERKEICLHGRKWEPTFHEKYEWASNQARALGEEIHQKNNAFVMCTRDNYHKQRLSARHSRFSTLHSQPNSAGR